MSIDRLQGTDGIRRPVALSTDPRVAGLTPLAAFLDHGLITEQFVELYTYAYTSSLEVADEIVIGWDPRDPGGDFTGAAVRGIRKAGAKAQVLGVFPTPGVAIYQMWSGAPAAFMITASHNFRDQNGIKIFHGPNGLKLFPDDDRALTKRVLELDYEHVASLPETGRIEEHREDALLVLREFHLDPRNSWLPAGESLGDFPLVVDAANGAFSGIAADIFRELHGGDVIEVNGDAAGGQVNKDSGVADLEGHASIERDDPRFASHAAVREVFARRGKAAVFDADGDRFYRLDYDPQSDSILVLSGDETAVHQASFHAPPPPGTLYINTVESDLNAARHAARIGYEPRLTAVGDKWVLQEAARDPERYGIGSEETGHNISKGWLTALDGTTKEVFTGNGLKSALNTFVATRGMSPAAAHRPFAPGFKQTFYVYYTDKGALEAGSDVFEGVAATIEECCTIGPVRRVEYASEPDMLYLAVDGDDGLQRAGIFVRNSGTEEKTGVNVRGMTADAAALRAIGEQALLFLAAHMKAHDHPMARAERAILEALAEGPRAEADLPIPDGVHSERLLLELSNKEKVIAAENDRYVRTERGAKMLEAWS
jgi:phosphomannomutase